MHGNSKKRLRN